MLVFTYKTVLKTRTMAGHPRFVLPALGIVCYEDRHENMLGKFVEWFNEEFYPDELIVTELEIAPEVTETALTFAKELEAKAPTEVVDAVNHDLMNASAEMLRQFIGKPKSDR